MLNWTLLQSLLIIAIACSSITVVFIQKTKKFCRSSRCITNYGLFVNMVLGFCFSQTFSNINYIESLWIGLFSFLGADTIYRNLEGKMASYTELTTNKNTTSNSTNSEIDSTLSKNIIEKDSSNLKTTNINTDDVIGEITYE